jgi:cytoskeletal protein CcmA (bactofilin family)
MFGNNKSSDETSKTSSSTTPSSGLNALAKGTSMEGTLKCESDLRIDGKIKGTLICEAKLIIGPTGSIEGDVRCQNAVIEGSFKGTLKVKELLNVRENAEVEGEIITNKLLVQSGALFNVSCKMESGSGAGSNVKPNPAKDESKSSGAK